MSYKRQLPILVVIIVGFFTLLGFFINNPTVQRIANNESTQWFNIISGFALFLGSLNLLKMHSHKIIYKKENFQYSIVSVFGFLIMIIFGFIANGSESKLGEHILDPNSYFFQAFWNIYTPLSATMFALLAFYVASASYRAFRIRNFEATLLLLSGIILMIGRVPIGQQIPWWFVIILYVMGMTALLAMLINKRKNIIIVFIGLLSFSFIFALFSGWSHSPPSFLNLNAIQEWIFMIPAAAGSRAIMIGIALGIIGTSFRIITGREKSIFGD